MELSTDNLIMKTIINIIYLGLAETRFNVQTELAIMLNKIKQDVL